MMSALHQGHAQVTSRPCRSGLVSWGGIPISGGMRSSLGASAGARRCALSPSLRPGLCAGPVLRPADRQDFAFVIRVCFDRTAVLRHDGSQDPFKKERAECANLFYSASASRPWPCRAVSTRRPNAPLQGLRRALSSREAPGATRSSVRSSGVRRGLSLVACRACRPVADRLTGASDANQGLDTIRTIRPGGVFIFASCRPAGAGAPVRKGKETRCSRRS